MIQFFRKIVRFVSKLIFTYSFSGGLYLLIETAWDGSTDLSMYYLAGFLGLLALMINNIFTYETDFLLQITTLTLIGTALEGVIGNTINTDFHIWDYRNMIGSMWNDQINIIFMILWAILFAIIIPVLDYIEYRLFNYKPDCPPYYKIFGKVIFTVKR